LYYSGKAQSKHAQQNYRKQLDVTRLTTAHPLDVSLEVLR
jgi:hypothetical protein